MSKGKEENHGKLHHNVNAESDNEHDRPGSKQSDVESYFGNQPGCSKGNNNQSNSSQTDDSKQTGDARSDTNEFLCCWEEDNPVPKDLRNTMLQETGDWMRSFATIGFFAEWKDEEWWTRFVEKAGDKRRDEHHYWVFLLSFLFRFCSFHEI